MRSASIGDAPRLRRSAQQRGVAAGRASDHAALLARRRQASHSSHDDVLEELPRELLEPVARDDELAAFAVDVAQTASPPRPRLRGRDSLAVFASPCSQRMVYACVVNIDSTINMRHRNSVARCREAVAPARREPRDALRVREPRPCPLRGRRRAASARRYSRDDIERLRARSEERRNPGKAAEQALRWGLPMLESAITLIADEQALLPRPRRRGARARALDRRGRRRSSGRAPPTAARSARRARQRRPDARPDVRSSPRRSRRSPSLRRRSARVRSRPARGGADGLADRAACHAASPRAPAALRATIDATLAQRLEGDRARRPLRAALISARITSSTCRRSRRARRLGRRVAVRRRHRRARGAGGNEARRRHGARRACSTVRRRARPARCVQRAPAPRRESKASATALSRRRSARRRCLLLEAAEVAGVTLARASPRRRSRLGEAAERRLRARRSRARASACRTAPH